jgi:hypothetical protein
MSAVGQLTTLAEDCFPRASRSFGPISNAATGQKGKNDEQGEDELLRGRKAKYWDRAEKEVFLQTIAASGVTHK